MLIDEILSTPQGPPPLYRGAGIQLDSGLSLNNLLEQADLNWHPVKRPLQTDDGVTLPRFGLWRSDRHDQSGFLDVCTDSYKPHTNSEIFSPIVDFSQAIGAPLERIGTFDNGARIWASLDVPVQREVKKGDIWGMKILVRSGHQVGISTSLRFMLLRLVCSNGMKVTENARCLRFTHGAKLGIDRQSRMTTFLREAEELMTGELERIAVLYETPLTPAVRRAMLLHLFGTDEDWSTLFERLRLERQADRKMGAEILDRIINASERSASIWAGLGTSTLLQRVVTAMQMQPGRNYTQGRMADLTNGVAYMNSQLRGQGDAGTESALFGAYAADTSRVVEVALEQYVPAMRELAVA